MMDQKHIGYTSWAEPRMDTMPAVVEPQLADTADFGVAIDGSADAWPGSQQEAALPAFDSINKQRSYIEVLCPRNQTDPVQVQCRPGMDQDYRDKTSKAEDRCLWVEIDWAKAKDGEAKGTVTITSGDKSVPVQVRAVKGDQQPGV